MVKNKSAIIIIIFICIISLGCKKKNSDADIISLILLTQSPISVRFTTLEQSVAVNQFERIFNSIWLSVFPSVYAATSYAGDTSINAYFDTFYNNIGTLVGTYTPSKFKLPVMQIKMYNYKNYSPNHAIDFSTSRDLNQIMEGDDSWIHADFTNPISNTCGTIPSGEYNALIIAFAVEYFRSSMQLCKGACKLVGFTATPEIEVTIPGYAGELSNLTEFRDYDRSGDLCLGSSGNYPCGFLYPEGPITIERIARKNISGDLFSFSWHFLYPSVQGDDFISMSRTKYLPESAVNIFYVSGYNTENSIVVSQLPIFDLSPYIDPGIARCFSGWDGLLKIPFTGFTVNGSESVVIEIVFDINNIISVYDNDTPGDKSDDIVCLSKDWWNRISINVIQ